MSHRICRAPIVSVHPYGVVVAVEGERLLVHAHDQSWYWPCNALRHSRVGQECDVWVGDLERYGAVTRIASFRLAHPESDPRRRFAVGSVVCGIVVMSDENGVSVDFGPAQLADFHISDLRKHGVRVSGLTAGDPFVARIASIWDEDATIILEPTS